MSGVQGVGVVFPGVDGAFSYKVPPQVSASVAAGMRVLAPFGRRRMTGTIVSVQAAPDEKATREIEHLLDARPAFSASMLKFTRWMSEYYLCAWGDVLKAALPAGISLDEKSHWTLAADEEKITRYAEANPDAQGVMKALQSGPLSSQRMLKSFGLKRDSALLKRMEKAGVAVFRPVLRPPRVKSQFDSLVTLAPRIREQYGPDLFAQLRSVHEQHLIREVFESGPDGVLRSDLLKGAASARRQAFARLMAAGSLELRVEEVSRWDPQTERIPDTVEPTELTAAQIEAVDAISTALTTGAFAPFLLFGVTGSGKTQVYIEAARRALALGKTALVLLPEIALTPFLWARFYRAFGDRVAIQHSAQSPAVRYDLWRAIHSGRYPVVVGARSAVFAPLAGLGLIVVDEEQEASYKQDEPEPRYHARDAALMRAHMETAAIVLGSATPSAESYHHAQSGRYRLLRLPQRVGGALPPEVRIVTWKPRRPKEEPKPAEAKSKRRRAPVEEPPILTDELKACLTDALAQGRQAILLQNRRGFSPFLLCPSCGTVPVCPNCSVSLTYHRKGLALRCHYCDHREPAPDSCPRCGASEWLAQGLGTQRLEEELAVNFPQARILRMDSDTAARRGMHGRMVSAFAAGEYDLLAGTQMVAKGLDFPNVHVSAVVQADTELFYPDFRASEKGAALILQASGRAGRSDRQGIVIVQTAAPAHPVIRAAASGDWEGFLKSEIASRSQSAYPPFARLVLIRAVGKDESSTVRALLRLRRLLQGKPVQVLGPAPAVVSKMRERFRYQMLVRTLRENDPAGSALRESVRQAVVEYKRARGESGVTLEVDVDPQSVA
ncbi:MAG: primosomal protein N' [bacterium]|nr:primosomal protein N' [bacterium]